MIGASFGFPACSTATIRRLASRNLAVSVAGMEISTFFASGVPRVGDHLGNGHCVRIWNWQLDIVHNRSFHCRSHRFHNMSPKVNLMDRTLTTLPSNRAIRLNNVSCAYCGIELTNDTKNREHVIGGRFVPQGKLVACWNLIINVCRTCNEIKADLEDDISAITMQPDSFGIFGHDDVLATLDAARKSKNSYSRRTRKPVMCSQEQMKVNMPFGQGASISFQFQCPPQIDRPRLFLLARMQLMGFFYWITFQENTMQGHYWPGGFYPLIYANRSDWGNSALTTFADAVADWAPRVVAATADGFYKIIIKRHPQAACWSWAIEWNHAVRVIGFFGDDETHQILVAGLPKPEMKLISSTPDSTLRYRRETPLADD